MCVLPWRRHYYLLDLCYYGNTLLLLHLWVLPKSYLLARTTFALNSGPLAFTILAFRNSLVYHDMVSVYMSVYHDMVSVYMSVYHDMVSVYHDMVSVYHDMVSVYHDMVSGFQGIPNACRP